MKTSKLTARLVLILSAITILMLLALPVAAGDCLRGLPCGSVPWNLPALPTLHSPTPMPTFFLTATPSPTMTPTNFTPSPTSTATNTPTSTFTATNTPTETPFFDEQDLQDQITTLEAIIDATPMIIDINGTPVMASTQIALTGDGIQDLFGKVKGILGADWGGFSPLFQAFLVSVAVTFVVVAAVYAAPIIGFVFGIVRKIYTAIMEFIPL
jgi:hypothetical protein